MVFKITVSLLILFSCFCSNSDKEGVFIEENQNIDMENKDLIISFELISRETSKDSNSEKTIIRITEEYIFCSKEYSGFKAPDNDSFKKKMNRDRKKSILDFISKNKFNVDIEESKSTEGIGIEGSLKISIFLPSPTHIEIKGKTNIWGSDDYVKKTWGKKYVKTRCNIENIEYFEKAREFIHLIERL